jgi:glycosyltransferase involved in cell wall biosynthesis
VRGDLSIPDGATVFLTVARLVRWKNVDLIIRALGALRDENAYFIVVGAGPERENLRQLAIECAVESRTRFVGQIAEPAEYYAASDVFVLPSKIESFGNVYAEAMLMGLPCIGMTHRPPYVLSSAQDVIPEGIAGYCVSDVEELLKIMHRLIRDPDLRRELGENAYRHALQQYTIERYSETLLALAGARFDIR